ncbi:hypothetical protein QNH47_06210 [Virgibacillus halodenitrificans]|uniref:hypothetical protein n=1 Tax=Virgibacillus halodenitrificans TaxID=1482 RepID=UPI0024C004DA|nr:hypothetical protein [Virgibacillus halodenitrificans]WHX27446.1 hypothetical protein QNH47_06210 [Virgibacillus halodenitrificans]
MSEQTVFLYQPYEKHEQHSVLNLEAGEAQQLITEGKAVAVNLGDYGEYRKKAQAVHSDYKRAERKIKQSDNPLHTDEYKRYELDKAYQDYEQQTKALQAEWEQKRKEMQADARRKAARATVHISESDNQTAEQVASRIALNIAGASNAASLTEVVDRASQDVSYLSDAEKTALQSKLAGIISQIEGKADRYGVKVNANKIIQEAQDVRNMDLLAEKVADQLPSSIDVEYRTKNAVKRRRTSTVRGI